MSTHYPSRAEAMGHYYSLQVGDTFDSEDTCHRCGKMLTGHYNAATATLEVRWHHPDSCIEHLRQRIELLEQKVG